MTSTHKPEFKTTSYEAWLDEGTARKLDGPHQIQGYQRFEFRFEGHPVGIWNGHDEAGFLDAIDLPDASSESVDVPDYVPPRYRQQLEAESRNRTAQLSAARSLGIDVDNGTGVTVENIPAATPVAAGTDASYKTEHAALLDRPSEHLPPGAHVGDAEPTQPERYSDTHGIAETKEVSGG